MKYRWNIYKFQPITELNSQNKCKSKCVNSQNVQSQDNIYTTSGNIQISKVLKWAHKKLKKSSFDKSCWSSVMCSNPGFNLQKFQVNSHFPPVFAKVFSPLTFQSPDNIQVQQQFLRFLELFLLSVHPLFILCYLIKIPAYNFIWGPPFWFHKNQFQFFNLFSA